MLVLLLTVSVFHSVRALRCGDCAADCGSPGVCETKGKCFLRRDVNGLIYRGCADGKRWNGLLYTYNGCQFQNYLGWNGEKVYWCFCDEDNCNDQKMEVLQEKFGVQPLSVTQYTDTGPLGGLLGPAKPTNAGPMSDYTQEGEFDQQREVAPGQIERQGQLNNQKGQGRTPPQGREVNFRDVNNIGLQGFERKAPAVPELNGIPRFQTAGEKSPNDQFATADPRFTSDPKFNALSPTDLSPTKQNFPNKQGSPGYFRYVPSDPDYVQVGPGQGPMTRETLLEVLRQNGYDIQQHNDGKSAGAGGVVLTYKTPDGSTGQPGAKNRDPNSFDLLPESNPNSVIAPGDILSFLNNIRNTDSNSRSTNTQNNEINNNLKGRNNPVTKQPRPETTTRASIMFTNSDTKPNVRSVSTSDELKQFVTTTGSPQTTTETLRRDDLAQGTVSSKPAQFDDIVPPTEIVNIQDFLNSMKKDDEIPKETNATSKANVTSDAKVNVTTPSAEPDEQDISNEIPASPECLPTWIYNKEQNSCYKIERQRKTFFEAAYNCSQYDSKAHLVSIESEEEYKYIVYNLQEQEKHLNGWQGWWTSGVYDPTIREFIWLNTGFVISRLNPMWHPDLLMTPFQQTCVWLVPNAGHPLGNYGCSQSSGFICELELT